MKPVEVLIPNYEGGDAVRLCIESIRKRTNYAPGYGITVFDSYASGKDREALKEYQRAGKIRLIEAPGRVSHGDAVRELVKQCSTDWAVILDSDSEIISSDWINVLAAGMTNDDKTLLVGRFRPHINNMPRTLISPTFWLAGMLLNVKSYRPMADDRDFPYRKVLLCDYPWKNLYEDKLPEDHDGYLHLETGGWLAGRILAGEVHSQVAPIADHFWPKCVVHYGGLSRNAFRPDHPAFAGRISQVRRNLEKLRKEG